MASTASTNTSNGTARQQPTYHYIDKVLVPTNFNLITLFDKYHINVENGWSQLLNREFKLIDIDPLVKAFSFYYASRYIYPPIKDRSETSRKYVCKCCQTFSLQVQIKAVEGIDKIGVIVHIDEHHDTTVCEKTNEILEGYLVDNLPSTLAWTNDDNTLWNILSSKLLKQTIDGSGYVSSMDLSTFGRILFQMRAKKKVIAANKYLLMPKFLRQIHALNNKNTVALQVDDNECFLRSFIAIPKLPEKVKGICLPVLFVSTTQCTHHLYNGHVMILAATTHIGVTIPLAMAHVPTRLPHDILWFITMIGETGLDFSKYPIYSRDSILFTVYEMCKSQGITLNIKFQTEYITRVARYLFAIRDPQNMESLTHGIQAMQCGGTFEDFLQATDNLKTIVTKKRRQLGWELIYYLLNIHPVHWTTFANNPEVPDDDWIEDYFQYYRSVRNHLFKINDPEPSCTSSVMVDTMLGFYDNTSKFHLFHGPNVVDIMAVTIASDESFISVTQSMPFDAIKIFLDSVNKIDTDLAVKMLEYKPVSHPEPDSYDLDSRRAKKLLDFMKSLPLIRIPTFREFTEVHAIDIIFPPPSYDDAASIDFTVSRDTTPLKRTLPKFGVFILPNEANPTSTHRNSLFRYMDSLTVAPTDILTHDNTALTINLTNCMCCGATDHNIRTCPQYLSGIEYVKRPERLNNGRYKVLLGITTTFTRLRVKLDVTYKPNHVVDTSQYNATYVTNCNFYISCLTQNYTPAEDYFVRGKKRKTPPTRTTTTTTPPPQQQQPSQQQPQPQQEATNNVGDAVSGIQQLFEDNSNNQHQGEVNIDGINFRNIDVGEINIADVDAIDMNNNNEDGRQQENDANP